MAQNDDRQPITPMVIGPPPYLPCFQHFGSPRRVFNPRSRWTGFLFGNFERFASPRWRRVVGALLTDPMDVPDHLPAVYRLVSLISRGLTRCGCELSCDTPCFLDPRRHSPIGSPSFACASQTCSSLPHLPYSSAPVSSPSFPLTPTPPTSEDVVPSPTNSSSLQLRPALLPTRS